MTYTPEHLTERLTDAHHAVVSAQLALEVDDTAANFRAVVKADQRLLDAAIDAGMDRDHDEVSGWSAERIAAWLSSGPAPRAWAGTGYALNYRQPWFVGVSA